MAKAKKKVTKKKVVVVKVVKYPFLEEQRRGLKLEMDQSQARLNGITKMYNEVNAVILRG